MSNVIFYIGGYARRPEFRVKTVAKKNAKGEMVFEKRATNQKAYGQLEKMAVLYDTMKKSHPNILFAEPTLNKKRFALELEAIDGQGIETLLIEAALRDDQKTVFSLLDNYESLLDSLGVTGKNASFKSKEIFGPEGFKAFSASKKYIYPGLIDLNFDNIIKTKKDELVVIDYEWSFDEYIPVDYILARAVMWFGLRYTDQFRLHAPHIPMTGLSSELILPTFIYERYSHLQKAIEAAYEIEWSHLQKWINNEFPKELHPPVSASTDIPKRIFSIESFRVHIDFLESEINRLDRENQQLGKEVTDIKNGKVYRGIQKVKRLIN